MNGVDAAAFSAIKLVASSAYFSAMVKRSAGCSSTAVPLSRGSGVGWYG